MTLYLHIGTMKTGTSSIQDFLFANRSILLKQDFLYPISIKNIYHLNDHNPLVDSSTRGKICNKQLKKLNKEIIQSKANKIIISAENIQWRLNSIDQIQNMKDSFQKLGFKKIYIILYLRNPVDLFISMCSQSLKDNDLNDFSLSLPQENKKALVLCNHQQTIQKYEAIFGKENLKIRLFEKDEFYKQDLLKDFIHILSLSWNENFLLPQKQNETLNLLGMKILHEANLKNITLSYQSRYIDIVNFFDKYFSNTKEERLKFSPSQEIYQSYLHYFKISNEWVKQNYFTHKNRLFKEKNMEQYKENYEIKEFCNSDLESVINFSLDILDSKNKEINILKELLNKKEMKIAIFIYNKRKKIKSFFKNILSFIPFSSFSKTSNNF
ncbi:hypothetical protein A9372_02165 [Campylobacter jejuni]|nr:hypothetical protein [Campylobacter jejuni]